MVRTDLIDIDFAYGSLQILFGVTFHVESGEVLGLLGTNGAGKSTVLRVLSGLSPPAAGRIVLDGSDVTRTPAERMAALGVVQVPGGRAIFPDLTVHENLLVGGYLLGKHARSVAERELDRFPALRKSARRAAGSLSGGQQQQLAIAKALMLEPKVLCIDELSLGLAPTVVADLLDTIRQINATGVSIVIVEQSLNIAASICRRAIFLEKGAVVFAGDPSELLERGDIARAVFLGAGKKRRVTKLGVVALGISAGLQYGLLATGLVLIYRAGRFVNFAQAQMGVFAAIVLAKLELDHGWPYPLALLAGLAVAAGTAVVVERTVIQKLFDAPRLVLMVITIAVTQNLFGLTLFGGFHLGRHQILPASPLVLNTTRVSAKGGFPVPFHLSVTIGGVRLDSAQLLTLGVAPAVAFGLYIYFARTRTGRAIRAASSNPDAARLAGISVRRVSLQVWIVAGVLSGLAAVLAQPSQPAFSQAAPGPGLLLRGLAAAMLAGFFDFRIAFLGGVAVGVIEQVAGYNLHTPGISELAVLAVLLVGVAWRGRRLAATVRRGDDVLVAATPKSVLTPRLRQLSLARNLDRWAWAFLFLALLVLPRLPGVTSGSRSAALVQIVSFAIVGLSLTLLTGWAGQVSLGQFALLGVGAFVAAHLVDGHHVGLPLVIVGAGAAASGCAVIVGLPALRYRGLFLAVTTLGLAVVAPAWLFHEHFMGIPRGGAAQMPLDRLLLPFGGHLTSYREVYYLALGVLALVSAALARVRRSELGRALVAVRDNDSAASAAGLSPATTKLVALALSGFIAGVAGSLWAMANSTFSFVSFDAEQSLIMLSVAIVGGLGTLCGPILGAFAVFAWPYLVPNQNTAVARAIFSGGLLVIFMTNAPGGLASLLHRARRRFLTYLESTLPARPFGSDPDAPPLVVTGLTVSFGGLCALSGIDLNVGAGEIVGLIGGNGAGKTTLMNCVSGHVNPDAGKISLFGQDAFRLSPRFRRALGAARSFQDATLYPGLTVLEAVELSVDFDDHVSGVATFFGAPWLGSAERRKSAAAVRALQLVGLEDHQHVLISELSTGMRRLAELATVVAARPTLVLLDEPTAGIAQREVEQFAAVLRQIKDELDCAVLLIEHDMPLVMSLADRVYCLESGQVIAVGTPAAIQANPEVISSYLGTDPTSVERSGSATVNGTDESATASTTRRVQATVERRTRRRREQAANENSVTTNGRAGQAATDGTPHRSGRNT